MSAGAVVKTITELVPGDIFKSYRWKDDYVLLGPSYDKQNRYDIKNMRTGEVVSGWRSAGNEQFIFKGHSYDVAYTTAKDTEMPSSSKTTDLKDRVKATKKTLKDLQKQLKQQQKTEKEATRRRKAQDARHATALETLERVAGGKDNSAAVEAARSLLNS